MARDLRLRVVCALVVAGVSGAPSCSWDAATTSTRATIPPAYRYDAGPGRVGQVVDLTNDGVSGGSDARKVGRRTYEIRQGGATSRVVLPPMRLARAVAVAKASASTVPVACGALGPWFAGQVHAAVGATEGLVDAGLPAEDESFALLQHLAGPQYRTRRTIAASRCDPTSVSGAAAHQLSRSDRARIGRLLGAGAIDPTMFVTNLLTS